MFKSSDFLNPVKPEYLIMALINMCKLENTFSSCMGITILRNALTHLKQEDYRAWCDKSVSRETDDRVK